jgi:localization factor PodJL
MRSAPWHVKGIAPAARESAQEAARRSGQSLGDWLNSAILNAAGPLPERRHPAATELPLSDRASVREPDTAGLDDRLDQLTRQIDRLVGAAARSHDSVPHQMAQAIGRLDQRLDDIIRQGRRAADELERRTGSIDRALASLGQDKLKSTYVPAMPASESVDRAVAEIAARQRELDGGRAGPEAYAPPPKPRSHDPVQDRHQDRHPHRDRDRNETSIQASTQARAQDPVPDRSPPAGGSTAFDFSGLQDQLRSLTSRIETLNRPCGVGDAVASLRQELAEIGGALREAMPRRAVEALEGEIRKLADQIAGSRNSGMGPAALSGLERGLAEVRDALNSLTPAENLVGFQEAIQALTRKVDLLSLGGTNGSDPAMLGQVQSAVETLRGLVGQVASNEALTSLAVEVRALGEKIDRVLARPADDLLKTLDRRINAIAEAIEAVRLEGSRTVPTRFEELINSLNDKIERLQLGRTDQLAIGALEERITRLVEKLDASEARLGHLGAIERGMAELLVHLEEMRAAQTAFAAQTALAAQTTLATQTPLAGQTAFPFPTTPAAKVAAPPVVDLLRRDVADLKQTQSTTGRRTEASLEAVHGTIGDVVNRLAMIESDLRTEPRTPPPPPPGPGADPDKNSDDSPPVSLRAAEPPAPAAAPPAPPVRAKPPAGSARKPIDPSLPPDYPLEPGSGVPRTRTASGTERDGAHETALRASRPEPAADAEAPNFLEAARRAAKAAALQQRSEDRTDGENSGSLLSDRLKQMFVGAGVVLAVAGAFRFAGVYLDPDRVILADAPASRSEDVRSTPDLAASARAIAVPGLAELVPPSTKTLSPIAPPVAIVPGERSFAAAPPSGALAPDRSSRLAAGVNGNTDITGSLPSPRVITAPTVTAAVPPAASISPPVPAAPTPAPTPVASLSPAPAAPVPASPVTAAPIAPPAVAADPQAAEGITKGLLAAATAGNPAAAYEIASRYAEGRGVTQSYKDAVGWYERAAKSGLAPAQFRLGTMYEKGLGVQKDTKEARRLYLAAADQQNAKAMHNIAVLYAEGIDGKPDYRTAAQWFRKAAERGVVDSQYNLAILYARGIGLEQDLVQSFKWFSLAAAGGDKDAAKKRDDVAGRLDQGKLAQARDAVSTFTVTPQPEAATTVRLPPEGWEKASRPIAAPGKLKDRAQKQASMQR